MKKGAKSQVFEGQGKPLDALSWKATPSKLFLSPF